MRSLVALSLVGGLTATAWARPDGNNDRPPPPSMMRQEVQMRMPVDGRGDTMMPIRAERPDPWMRAEKPQAERPPTSGQRMELPLKSDVAQKAHPGDSREMAPKPQALDARVQNGKPVDDRMGRAAAKPALPIKTEVTMKQQHGDNFDGASTAPAAASSSAAKSSSASAQKRNAMTSHDKEMLCRMAGVCLPQSHAGDDVEDKTE